MYSAPLHSLTPSLACTALPSGRLRTSAAEARPSASLALASACDTRSRYCASSLFSRSMADEEEEEMAPAPVEPGGGGMPEETGVLVGYKRRGREG